MVFQLRENESVALLMLRSWMTWMELISFTGNTVGLVQRSLGLGCLVSEPHQFVLLPFSARWLTNDQLIETVVL